MVSILMRPALSSAKSAFNHVWNWRPTLNKWIHPPIHPSVICSFCRCISSSKVIQNRLVGFYLYSTFFFFFSQVPYIEEMHSWLNHGVPFLTNFANRMNLSIKACHGFLALRPFFLYFNHNRLSTHIKYAAFISTEKKKGRHSKPELCSLAYS